MATPRQSVNLSRKEFKAIFKSVSSGHIFFGSELKDFESQFAKYIGVKYALALSSGRAAQYLALKSLNLDAESEIIVPAYTFYIVPIIVKLAGLTPVFVDAKPDTYNLDPVEIERKITLKTRCIIATHIAGQPCDIDKILQIAKEHNLYVIEDCAEACGSEYKGRKVGSFGDISYYSFHVSKNLTCLGGGMVTANDEKIFNRILELASEEPLKSRFGLFRNVFYAFVTYLFTRPIIFTFSAYPLIVLSHLIDVDWIDRMFKEDISSSFAISQKRITRMTNLQASVGIEQLHRLEEMNSQRIRNAMILHDTLKDCKNVSMQKILPGIKNTYLYFYAQVPNRKKVCKRLAMCRIDSKEDGLCVCPKLDIFKETKDNYPVTEQLVSSNIVLPNFPSLKEKHMRKIACKIRDILMEFNI